MTTSTCRYPGDPRDGRRQRRNSTRLLRTHQPHCEQSTCPGCAPCPERHCRVCTHTHVTVDGRGTDHTCGTCLATTRTNLEQIWNHSARLLGETIRRGINSQAATLAGPIGNLEAWHNRRMSALAGRIDPVWLTEQVDVHHPLWVLGTWERETRIHLDQTLSAGTSQPTLTEARDYLDHHLTWLAHDPDFAFDELADDLHACRTHLETVLHDGDRPETGAPCPTCGRADLVKDYGDTEPDDRWTCPRCHQWWTEHDYRAKVAGTYVQLAPALTASQIHATYRVPEGTTRSWAARGRVTKRGHDDRGRQLYDVSDVLACRDHRTETA